MSYLEANLIEKINQREATIGIVGLGYVGLPLVVAFAEAGFKVLGVDIDAQKVAAMNNGLSHVEDVEDATVQKLVSAGQFEATTDYSRLTEADTISICVPTPLHKTKDPNISYIVSAAEQIAKAGVSGKLVILESTSYPGTTREVMLPLLHDEELNVGENFFLAFSPERIDPGRTDYIMWNTPKVVGGMTPSCLAVSCALYKTIVESVVPVSSPDAAEMAKLFENTFRAVNIGLVNEIALICDKLDLDVWEIVEAAATKPYGFMKFTPGPGLGGHCIPIDPHYLSWKMKSLDYTARFVELADEINRSMPEYVVQKVADGLNLAKKAVNGSRVLIMGVAYKPNVSDVRESPALDIIKLLQEKGAEVVFSDPFVEKLNSGGKTLEAVPLTADGLKESDAVVIVTNHSAIDWDFVVEHSQLLIDTRNVANLSAADHPVRF